MKENQHLFVRPCQSRWYESYIHHWAFELKTEGQLLIIRRYETVLKTPSVWHVVSAHGVAVPIEGITSEGFLRFPMGKHVCLSTNILTSKIQPNEYPTYIQRISLVWIGSLELSYRTREHTVSVSWFFKCPFTCKLKNKCNNHLNCFKRQTLYN